MDEFHRIVVGVDFGTTYTAVAWADTSNPAQVELITNWPTSGQIVGVQTPSEVSYDDSGTAQFSWGYNISPRARKVGFSLGIRTTIDASLQVQWFKLGLELEREVLTLPPNMTSVDVVHDFLSAIYKHTMATLYRRFDRGAMQMTKIDFVLTVPAIWSDAAKSKVEDAATRAGMGNEHHLKLVSEPESAAVYTIKSLDKAHARFKAQDRVIVCDAGGGTVDLIAYEIMQIAPHLSVVECTAGTGDFCGSTFIDREFDKLFTRRMGHHYNNVSIQNRQQTVKNFEGAKAAFRDDSSQPMFYVNVPTVGTLEQCRVYGGNFEITQLEMRNLFDVVVDQVLNLISTQVSKASGGPYSVNSILLVGGFGESEYLYRRIDRWASQSDIQVIQPRNAATSIVRGALLKGLEPRIGRLKTEVKRRARRSYGVAGQQPFITGKHLERDAIIDEHTGQKMARNQVSWFIRKVWLQIFPSHPSKG